MMKDAVLVPAVQTVPGFETKPYGKGVVITKYPGQAPEEGSTVRIPGTIGGKPVTAIGEGAFSGCRFLTSVTIPLGVTRIGDRAFSYCSGLRSVTIPESVINIGEGAFSHCGGLTSVTIPKCVVNIGAMAFSNCFSLKAIGVSPENRRYKDIDGVLFTKDGKTLLTYPPGGKAAYTIPEGVTAIGERAFTLCTNLMSVTIPEGVTTIGGEAFYICALTSVTIPASVADVGGRAFSYCSDLETISVSPENRHYKDIDGVLFTKDGETLLVYPEGGKTAYTIPPGVTGIGKRAFTFCARLTSVTIPESVTTVGERAFEDCFGLTSVAVPASVTNIGEYAFDGCFGLTLVTISTGAVGIGRGAFSDCDNLDITARETIEERFGNVVFLRPL